MRWRLSPIKARIHGARRILRQQAESAGKAASEAEMRGEIHFAASLRGKRAAYVEAERLLDALENDRRLQRWRRA